MCGITGFIAPGLARGDRLQVLAAMTRTLIHRGPDAEGLWLAEAETDAVGLGSRRLAVLDLSPAGNQPMTSRCGRLVVTFNGEIYDFRELHEALEAAGHFFPGGSDTRVFLEAVSAWGLEAALQRAGGMFAFALWDKAARTLTLARDRLGEKPLYYGSVGGALLFGSELKALLAFPGWQPQIDREALLLYLRYGYVPAPFAIFHGVRKLPPGHLVTLRTADLTAGALPAPLPFWNPRAVAMAGAGETRNLSPDEIADRLEAKLRAAIRRQLVADVPVGAFLSGGIDSSTIVALMQEEVRDPVKTFTIGFPERGFDEARMAQQVAAHLGTSHHQILITPREALEVIPDLPTCFDEPFADHSQIPQILLSRFSRRMVTVAMAGDGADELFGGYTRHTVVRQIWKAARMLPPALKGPLADAMAAIPPALLESAIDRCVGILPQAWRQRYSGLKVQKMAGILRSGSIDAWYSGLVSIWARPETLVPGAAEPPTLPLSPHLWPKLESFTERMLYLDQQSYLPDDILTKVDRAAMSTGLETRLPFLDPDLVRFSWSLPLGLKVRHGVGKWILRQVLFRFVPRRLVERPKTGLTIPLRDWLSGPLRDWAEGLLGENRLRAEGFLEPGPIRQRWADHLAGKADWNYQLWAILMFQAWLERWRSCAPAPAPA